jgi:hypothetical protein
MSNNFFDFSAIMQKVNLPALKYLFAIDHPLGKQLPRQSSVYFAALRQVCDQMKYQSFHKELLEFLE